MQGIRRSNYRFLKPHFCGNAYRTDPYREALANDDVTKFRLIFKSDREVNWEWKGIFLHRVIFYYRSLNVFKCILNLDGFDIDFVDERGRTLLMNIALTEEETYTYAFNKVPIEQFVLALIEKGANIHVIDDDGCTYLHMAARAAKVNNLAIGKMVIEKGANINARNNEGMTPLYFACRAGNANWIHMLLYYGADATIPSYDGVLPLFVPRMKYEKVTLLRDVIFYHTFSEDDDVTVSLANFVEAITNNLPVFDNISHVTYDIFDLKMFYDKLRLCNVKNVRLLLKKFSNLVKDMIDNYPVLEALLEFRQKFVSVYPMLPDILNLLLESEHISALIKNSNPSRSTIALMVKRFTHPNVLIEEKEITKMICLMLSYGLNVTSEDLDTVYHQYGHCELFKILLYIDIKMIPGQFHGNIAPLYYDQSVDFEDLFSTVSSSSLSEFLLEYYNHPKLKEILLNSTDNEMVVKVKKLPQIPLLLELSRNVARKYIVSRFHIQNSRQFYTVLKWLPVGELNKRILSLEKKLYYLD